MKVILPISAVVPTRNRSEVIKKTLASLAEQSAQPAQLIVVDASVDNRTQGIIHEWAAIASSECCVRYQRASKPGAATQRNQGVQSATQPFIWFFDDDVVFESDCLSRLWQAISSDSGLGGVSAMISNQRYSTPGQVTRTLYRLLDGKNRDSYAGRCIGPAFNILPEDDPKLPEVVSVEWLNSTCTMYRRASLPLPVFDAHFTGYSFMEDVALSLVVGKNWKLANARTARIFHDSQLADYKEDKSALSEMQLVNRHYVMTKLLGRDKFSDYAKLGLLEAFGVFTPLIRLSAWKTLPAVLLGKCRGVGSLLHTRDSKVSQIVLPETRRAVSSDEPAQR